MFINPAVSRRCSFPGVTHFLWLLESFPVFFFPTLNLEGRDLIETFLVGLSSPRFFTVFTCPFVGLVLIMIY